LTLISIQENLTHIHLFVNNLTKVEILRFFDYLYILIYNKQKQIMKKLLSILSLTIVVLLTSCKKEELVTPPTTTTPPIGDTTDTNQIVMDDYKLVVQVYDNSYVCNTSGWLYVYTYWDALQSFYYDDIQSSSFQTTGYGDLTEYTFQLPENEDAYIRFYFESTWSQGIDLNDFVDCTLYKNGTQIYYRHGTNGRSDMAATEIDLLP